MIRKEAQINYEKDIIDKSKEQPKLFYNFINSKTKKQEQLMKESPMTMKKT